MDDGSESDITASRTIDSTEDKIERKRLKKLQEAYEVVPLQPNERYRALNDLTKLYTNMIEMADRKTRFALIVLAALNTVNFVAAARPAISTQFAVQHLGVALYVTCYAALSLYLCIQAIGALKPRLITLTHRQHDVPEEQRLLNLVAFDVIPDLQANDYYERWRSAQFGHLNRELALRNQNLARIIVEKYRALSRLYNGLTVLVVLTSGVIVILLYTSTTG